MSRDPELQRLLDESAIRDVLSRYGRGIDRMDHEALLSMFWPGAMDEHGVYDGPIEGYVEWLRAYHRPDESWMHHNTTQRIEIDGDEAWTETYCIATNRVPASDGKPAVDRTVRIRYCDRFERRGEEWRIAHRKVVYSPSTVSTAFEDWQFGPTHLLESRTKRIRRTGAAAPERRRRSPPLPEPFPLTVAHVFDAVTARLEIEKTLCRYAWAWDFEFARGIGACFTEDVVGDFGVNVATASGSLRGDAVRVRGRDEMVAELERRRRGNFAEDERSLHRITNIWLRERVGDGVRVTSYCTFDVKKAGQHEWERRSAGYYDDDFAPVGDEWLIARRTWRFGASL